MWLVSCRLLLNCVHMKTLVSFLTWPWHNQNGPHNESVQPLVWYHSQVWVHSYALLIFTFRFSCEKLVLVGDPKVCALSYTHFTLATAEPLLKDTSEIRTPCLIWTLVWVPTSYEYTLLWNKDTSLNLDNYFGPNGICVIDNHFLSFCIFPLTLLYLVLLSPSSFPHLSPFLPSSSPLTVPSFYFPPTHLFPSLLLFFPPLLLSFLTPSLSPFISFYSSLPLHSPLPIHLLPATCSHCPRLRVSSREWTGTDIVWETSFHGEIRFHSMCMLFYIRSCVTQSIPLNHCI